MNIMLRKLIEAKTGDLSDSQFLYLCNLLDKDIKFNKIYFKKKATLPEVLNLAKNYVRLAKLIA